MNLSETCIKKPVFAWMLMLSLMLFGYLCFRGIGISQMPDVDFPVITVNVTWEGAAPEVMERDVVDIIEDSLMGLEDLKEISSTSRQGQASIKVELDLDRDIDVALQEAQSRISEVARRLPESIDPPILSKSNPEDQPILWMGVSADVSNKELMEYVDQHVRDQFKTIPGVAEVLMGGFIDRNMRIWIDRNKLEEYQLTVDDISNAIEKEHIELPAGRLETETTEAAVRVMGEAKNASEFEKIMINYRGGQPMYRPIPLKEVATIEDGLDNIRRLTRVNGKTAVGVGIRKQRGANAVAVAHQVFKRMEEVQKSLPKGYEIGINFDSTRFIEDSVHELIFTLILSALLTSLVCWLFLGSWSSTVNILLAIPTSILGTFLILRWMNFTLNTFTLLALTLAIGVVVDDAIMVLENIVRHRQKGEGQREAALKGVNEIALAATVATTAVVAIFLPVAFMKGIIGKFFFQFGLTISAAVLISLLEAISFAPMRCSQFLEVTPRKGWIGRSFEGGVNHLTEMYRSILGVLLNHKIIVLVASLVFFGLSLTVLPQIRREFVPAQDQSVFIARLKTPMGSSFEFTNQKFKEIEAYLSKRKEVRRYFIAVGGFGSGGRSNEGMVFISLKLPTDRPVDPATGKRPTQQEVMATFRKELGQISGVQIFFQDLSTRGFSADRGFPVEFTVRGSDWEKLAGYSEQIQAKLAAEGFFEDVDTDYLTGMPEVRIYPDRDKAFERGVSVETVAQTINSLISGKRISKFSSGGRRYDVRIQLIDSQRRKIEDLENLFVRNNRGEQVKLSELIRVEEGPSLLSITRRDRERAIGIFANVAEGKSQAEALQRAHTIASEILPGGYRAVFSGTSQTFKETFGSLLFALLLGIVISYMVLASQFNHIIHPLTVLLALPFSASGAFLALWLGKFSLNIFSMIGFLLLMGIVKKNSILLVEFTNQMREQGMSPLEALKTACPIRFRPILMTSVATIAAAIPPALALGPGAETRIPMAVTIIGGVTVSTILTLAVVPCAYLLFSKLEKKH